MSSNYPSDFHNVFDKSVLLLQLINWKMGLNANIFYTLSILLSRLLKCFKVIVFGAFVCAEEKGEDLE
jgi:hypothetical protein